MNCKACGEARHEDCEHPATCTCQHRPPRRIPLLEERTGVPLDNNAVTLAYMRELRAGNPRALEMYADLPPEDC